MTEFHLNSQDVCTVIFVKHGSFSFEFLRFSGYALFNLPVNMMTKRLGNIVHSDFFNNHLVEIVDNGDYRSLYFAGSILQSRISITAPHNLVLYYTRYMMAALLVQPQPKRVLLIGIGAGTLVSFLNHHFPECILDAVDHSPQVINLALGYFRMPNEPPISIHCSDGLEFLAQRNNRRRYDVILIDAFDENGMSKTIYTEDFFALCRKSLASDGVLSCNLWSGNLQELETVKQAFNKHSASRIYLPVQERGNIVGLGFNTPTPWEKIDRPEKELKELGKRYGFDITEIVRIAKKNNMDLRQRVGSFFNGH